MIQLNLLPDVKLQYIRARQRKRLVIGLSVIASVLFLTIFIALLLFVRVAQKKHMDDLNRDISSSTSDLKSKQDLDKILTIQNQLDSLPSLHDKKIISSRLFDYLIKLTPNKATISNVAADFSASTLTIKGSADALSTVNKFADTLKFTSFNSTGDSPIQGKAFNNVVLANFAVVNVAGASKGTGVTYELSMTFDPAIFANIKNSQEPEVTLSVPKIISTRSETEKPNDLFVPQPKLQDSGEAR